MNSTGYARLATCLALVAMWPGRVSAQAEPLLRLRATEAPKALAVLAATSEPVPRRLWVSQLSLTGAGVVELELARIELFARDFRLLVNGPPHRLPAVWRDPLLFSGCVIGAPDSRAFLYVTAAGEASGNITLHGSRWQLGSVRGALVAEPAADESSELTREVLGGLAEELRPTPKGAATRRVPSPVQIPVDLYSARILVETDHAIFMQLGGTVEKVSAWLLTNLGEVSTILEREVGVRLEIGSLSLWPEPGDPWWEEAADDPGYLRLRWEEFAASHPASAFPRAFVVLVTGNSAGGSFLLGACSAFGSGQPSDLAWSNKYFQNLAHEIGHVLGSDHTHCYGYSSSSDIGGTISGIPDLSYIRGPDGLPPVDTCRQETTCYAGPTVPLPPLQSSIMSYCGFTAHSYGAAGLYGDRSERVPAVMRATLDRDDAAYPNCLGAVTDALGLHVEAMSGSSATLAWTNLFANKIGWRLEERTAKGWKTLRQLPAQSTRVALKGLVPGVTHAYRLIARFRDNVSEPSTPVEVRLP